MSEVASPDGVSASAPSAQDVADRGPDSPASPGQPRIVVVGEALIDRVLRANGETEDAPGGSPANVALTLGRWARHPELVTMLGPDAAGDTVRAWLAQSGVAVVSSVEGPGESVVTSVATARLDASGAASYEFDLRWQLDRRSVGRSDILHVGSVGAFLLPGAEDVSALVAERSQQSLITFDPNIRPVLIADADADAVRARVDDLIRAADVVKLSDEDLEWLRPGADPLDAARDWQRSGPALVVVTRGASGATAVTSHGDLTVPSERTAVVDTIGAGDTFMAGLVEGLVRADLATASARPRLHDISLATVDRMLRLSAHAAAITVSRRGANPPWLHELGGPPAP
jgi:fructokinase